ncbi:hypothetical protein BDW68DRAFT_35486 [Aspergillus falconensis]
MAQGFKVCGLGVELLFLHLLLVCKVISSPVCRQFTTYTTIYHLSRLSTLLYLALRTNLDQHVFILIHLGFIFPPSNLILITLHMGVMRQDLQLAYSFGVWLFHVPKSSTLFTSC